MSKLNQAKEDLSQALANLETIILNKINLVKKSALINSNANEGNQEIIDSLYCKINSLQKSLVDLKEENEGLRSQNTELKNFKSQSKEIANQIRIDLLQIKKLYNTNL